MNHRPRRIAKDDDGDPAALQILLVTDILIGREQEIEPSFLRSLQERAVGQFIPSPCYRLDNDMPIK